MRTDCESHTVAVDDIQGIDTVISNLEFIKYDRLHLFLGLEHVSSKVGFLLREEGKLFSYVCS